MTIRLTIGHFTYLLAIIWNKAFIISSRFRDSGPKCIGSQPFDISGSRYVIGHITNSQVAISYRCSIVTKSLSISSRFRDNVHQTYRGHGLDLSGSRDVIGHVTVGLAIGYFLLVVLWTQVSTSNGFRDIPPHTSCAHRNNAESSFRMRDIT